MNCLSCGKIIEPVLNYCHHCGASIRGAGDEKIEKISNQTLNLLIAAIMIIPTAGLGIFVGMINVAKGAGFDNVVILAFVGVSFLILLVAELSLVRLLQNYTKAVKETIPDGKRGNVLEFSKPDEYFGERGVGGLNAAQEERNVSETRKMR